MLSSVRMVQHVNGLLFRTYTLISSSIYLSSGQMEAFTLAIHVPRPSRETATHVWLILWKAFQAIGENASRSVSELALGQSDFAVLEVLMHKGPQPVNVIGRKVQLTSGSITAAVDRLESRKLLRRTADPRDRRGRIVQLTGMGRHLIER